MIVGIDMCFVQAGEHEGELVCLVMWNDGRLLVATPIQGMAPPWLHHSLDAFIGADRRIPSGQDHDAIDTSEAGLRLDPPL
jgi:hypothetical protein